MLALVGHLGAGSSTGAPRRLFGHEGPCGAVPAELDRLEHRAPDLDGAPSAGAPPGFTGISFERCL